MQEKDLFKNYNNEMFLKGGEGGGSSFKLKKNSFGYCFVLNFKKSSHKYEKKNI